MKILENGKFNLIGAYAEGEEVKEILNYRGSRYIIRGPAVIKKIGELTVGINYKKM